jgi:hypothetical protein
LLGQSTLDEMTSPPPLLDTGTFSASSSRDALGRVLTAVSPTTPPSRTRMRAVGCGAVDLEHRGGQTTETVVGGSPTTPRPA